MQNITILEKSQKQTLFFFCGLSENSTTGTKNPKQMLDLPTIAEFTAQMHFKVLHEIMEEIKTKLSSVTPDPDPNVSTISLTLEHPLVQKYAKFVKEILLGRGFVVSLELGPTSQYPRMTFPVPGCDLSRDYYREKDPVRQTQVPNQSEPSRDRKLDNMGITCQGWHGAIQGWLYRNPRCNLKDLCNILEKMWDPTEYYLWDNALQEFRLVTMGKNNPNFVVGAEEGHYEESALQNVFAIYNRVLRFPAKAWSFLNQNFFLRLFF